MNYSNEDHVPDEAGGHSPDTTRMPKSGFWDTLGTVLEAISAGLEVLEVFGG